MRGRAQYLSAGRDLASAFPQVSLGTHACKVMLLVIPHTQVSLGTHIRKLMLLVIPHTQVSLGTHIRKLMLLVIPHTLLLAELLIHHRGSTAAPLLLCEVGVEAGGYVECERHIVWRVL